MLLLKFWADDLGANPISYATNVLGDTTLRILLASLTLTPLRLVYVAGVAALLHFSWLAKKGRNDPYLYATILAALLGVRGWPRVARALGKRRVVALGAPSTPKRVAGAP